MSSNGSEAPSDNSTGSMGGSGIRLPPISFLSRDNQTQQPLASVSPITQRPLGKLQVPAQYIRSNVSEQHISVSDDKEKMQLSGPRALDIYSAPQSEPKPPHQDDALTHHQQSSAAQSQHNYESRNQSRGESSEPDFVQNNGQPASHNYVVSSHGNQHQEQNPPYANEHSQSRQLQHHHHHHHHHISHEAGMQPYASETEENGLLKAQTAEKPVSHEPKMDRTSLNKIIEDLFPRRRHLGTIMYNPTTTWSTLQINQLHGLGSEDKSRLLEIQQEYNRRISQSYAFEEQTYVPVIPPLSEAYVNSFIDVKIPYKFIKEHLSSSISGKVQRRRELWGGFGDIYTDDSDILSVLTHLGLFNNALDLSGTNPSWAQKDVVRPLKVHYDDDGFELLDLSVTLLLLPPLSQYHGFYRNGINSRSWLGDSPHDGLSFGVFSIKWETYSSCIDERNLYKWAQKEDAVDRDYEKALLDSGTGWKFDSNYYKQLKRKYSSLEDKTGS